MKRLVFLLAAVLMTSVVSCRQDDENFGNEDNQNLKLINQATQKIGDSINTSDDLDGEPLAPPKK